MKSERNLVTNDLVIMSTSENRQAAAILAVNLVSFHRSQPSFKTGREFDISNTYLKFGRNPSLEDFSLKS